MIKKTFVLTAIILSLSATDLMADEDEKLTRTIFISDIHMCDYSTIHPTSTAYKPYGWFSEKHASLLANFLNQWAIDSLIKEVVILGDLFDGWVCPFDMDPLNGTDDANAMFLKMGSTDTQTNPINAPIITALQKLAKDGKLIYVRGNHDMLLTEDILEEIIPGIDWRNKYESEDGKIVAEHGSNYCLFNAPDDFDNKDDHTLPLGYFITRAASYKAAYKKTANNDNMPTTTPEIIKSYCSKQLEAGEISSNVNDGGISGVIYLGIILFLGAKEWPDPSIAVMNKLDDFDSMGMVVDVSKRYGDSYKKWPSSLNKVDAFTALLNEARDLYFGAKVVYIDNPDDKHQIVIFGHTHEAELKKDDASGKIYANTGTWVDSVQNCTYVVAEKKDNTYKVSVCQCNDTGTRVPFSYEGTGISN